MPLKKFVLIKDQTAYNKIEDLFLEKIHLKFL